MMIQGRRKNSKIGMAITIGPKAVNREGESILVIFTCVHYYCKRHPSMHMCGVSEYLCFGQLFLSRLSPTLCNFGMVEAVSTMFSRCKKDPTHHHHAPLFDTQPYVYRIKTFEHVTLWHCIVTLPYSLSQSSNHNDY